MKMDETFLQNPCQIIGKDELNPLNFDIFSSYSRDNGLLYSKDKQHLGADAPMYTDRNGVRNGTC
jgi:hypothetical protein